MDGGRGCLLKWTPGLFLLVVVCLFLPQLSYLEVANTSLTDSTASSVA